MRTFIGLEPFIDEDYARRLDHRFHALGCPPVLKKFTCSLDDLLGSWNQPWSSQTDLAWVVCLQRCGAIDDARAAKLVRALRAVWESNKGVSGEERILDALDGDMDLASTVNYGRTLQEPMFRLKLRDAMQLVIDDILALLSCVHRLALDNLDTLMLGHTHMNHGQPITYAHFLLSVFDGLYRGLQQFEQAYDFTNLNSGGCGSCSGTAWPVDRELMADLLGMDGVLEPTYDSESSQDHSLALLFALSNIAIHISRYAMTHYIWAIDEIDMIRTEPAYCGMSSFMPQKCDSGSLYEHVRIQAAEVTGETNKAMAVIKGEPHMDVLPALHLPDYACSGMRSAQRCIKTFTICLEKLLPQKERMREIVREGYSCATEVAYHLIRECGYGGRLAHSITATFVRMARMQGLKAYECTGELLDEAAAYLDQRKPGLDTATVQRCLDPDAFIASHKHLGGTAPEENARLLGKRQETLDAALQRQCQRVAHARDGLASLDAAADAILAAANG